MQGMRNTCTLDRKAHLSSIEHAICELSIFAEKTTAPAPLPHQYIGTVIDNTMSLLHAPANALDSGGRFVTFTNDDNWRSLMSAVHKSFLSSIHLATEMALDTFCQQHDTHVTSKLEQKIKDAFQALEAASLNTADISAPLKTLQSAFVPRHPTFNDYLETALEISQLTKGQKKEWRKFFGALSIARNKVSHSNAFLSDAEKTNMVQGKLEALISPTGTLQFNPTLYIRIVELTLNFFDQLLSKTET